MKYTLGAILVALSCCSGCMTQTVTRERGVGQSGGRVVSSQTLWIWQKDFWARK